MEPEPKRYAPPAAPVGDIAPQSPGRLPDWAAVLAGSAVDTGLTMFVAYWVALILSSEITDDEDFQDALLSVFDFGLTYAGRLFAFWMTLHICRSRSLRVVASVAALAL